MDGLKKAGPDLTRAGFLVALEKMSVNLGGLDIAFGPQNHQGLNTVYLTMVQKGKPVQGNKLWACLDVAGNKQDKAARRASR